MLKKTLITIACLLSSLSIAYMYLKADNHNLSAASSKYNVGGTLTGRVNLAPSGITGEHIGFQAGDHVMIGGNNPITNNPLSFQLLLYDKNYTDYDNTDVINVVRTPISNWLTISDEAVSQPFTFVPVFDAYAGMEGYYAYSDYINTDLYKQEATFNQYLAAHSETSLFAPRSLKELRYWSSFVGSSTPYNAVASIEAGAALKVAKDLWAYVPYAENCWYTVGDAFSEQGSAEMTKFSQDYFVAFGYTNYSHTVIGTIIASTGIAAEAPISTASVLRPYLYLDVSNVVFGLSTSNENDLRANVDDTFKVNKSSAYYTQGGAKMKLRLLDNNMNVSFNSITNSLGNTITKIVKDNKVYLNASGNQGTDYIISALIFDSGNHFIGYQPLDETQSGNHAYEFDLSGLAKGTYKIALVNEKYDPNSPDPTNSSLISDVKTLEIVDPISITVSPKTGLEYSKNVNDGNTVASFTIKGGADPITTTLISDASVTGHENDYQLFRISNGNVVVNEPNGLNAGDYYFKINAVDSNGDPAGGMNSATVHISVAKTALNIVLDDPNSTKKSITEATTGWSETATATPSDGVKITYEKVSGDIGLIDIDSDTGAITYKGNGAYGKITIRATADDDPSSGHDNYNSVSVTKEIVVYAEVNGSVTPHANSGDINTPTFTANDPNVKIGGTIGTIKGAPGTPDNVTSGEINYTFGLKSDGDGSFFAVNASSGDITTKANLSVGSYHITVTVSDKWSTKEIPVTINVGVAQAEDLKFYETSAAINAITTKSAKITDMNVTVYATVKGSSNPNQVTYKIKDGSTNIIEVNATGGAVTIHGVGTVTIVAEKKGSSGQADAQAELTFTVTAGAQNFIYTDSGGNELIKTGDKYSAYEEVYQKDKTFQLYTAGNPTGSTVTYQLKVGSPTDVITVDSNTGLVSILNASLNTQMGKVIVQATSHDPTGNYSDSTIELPINIKKADQTISFADVTYAVNGKGKVTPVINEQDISSNDGGVQVNDTDYYIAIDSSISTSIAWTKNGVDIEYNYSGDGIDIPLHVEKAGNRNYNKAEAAGTMHIMGPDENTLAINRPGKIVLNKGLIR